MQEIFLYCVTLKMNTLQAVETLGTARPTAWHHIAKAWNLQQHCYGTIKSHANFLQCIMLCLCHGRVLLAVLWRMLQDGPTDTSFLQTHRIVLPSVGQYLNFKRRASCTSWRHAGGRRNAVVGPAGWVLSQHLQHCAVPLCNTTNTLPLCVTGWHIQDLEHC